MSPIIPRKKRGRLPPQTVLRFGPFIGADERAVGATSAAAKWHVSRRPEFALTLLNCLPLRPGLRCRPGLSEASSKPANAPIQAFIDWRPGTNIVRALVVCGGEIYESIAGVWVKVISKVDQLNANISLATTTIVYWVAGQSGTAPVLVFSDGSSVPFMWDGTTGGGLTLLSSWPPIYGQPTIHAGKLFGIDATDRATFFWSEENDYNNVPANNAWTFTQTSQSPLTHLVGSNDGLYVIREQGASLIMGTVNEEFRSAATHDYISQTIGSRSPAALDKWNDRLIFFDQYKLPRMIGLGGQGVLRENDPVAPAHVCKRGIAAVADLKNLQCVVIDNHGLAFLSVGRNSLFDAEQLIVLDLLTDTYFGFWLFRHELVGPSFTLSRIGVLPGPSNASMLAIGTTDGRVLYAQMDDERGYDEYLQGQKPIPWAVVTSPVGGETPGQKYADTIYVAGQLDPSAQVAGRFVDADTGSAVRGDLTTSDEIGARGVFDFENRPGYISIGAGPVFARDIVVSLVAEFTNGATNQGRPLEVHQIEVPVQIMPPDPIGRL